MTVMLAALQTFIAGFISLLVHLFMDKFWNKRHLEAPPNQGANHRAEEPPNQGANHRAEEPPNQDAHQHGWVLPAYPLHDLTKIMAVITPQGIVYHNAYRPCHGTRIFIQLRHSLIQFNNQYVRRIYPKVFVQHVFKLQSQIYNIT